jgi:hypothetical protein
MMRVPSRGARMWLMEGEEEGGGEHLGWVWREVVCSCQVTCGLSVKLELEIGESGRCEGLR